jgi:hypothetical protein
MNRRRNFRSNFRKETAIETLERIEHGDNTANHQAIIDAFVARGIPAEEIVPRENVFTYQAWLALGRQVMKRPANIPSGQYGVKIPVIREERDLETKQVIKRITTFATVFHISQTHEIGTKPLPANPIPNPTPTPVQNGQSQVQTGEPGYPNTPPTQNRVSTSFQEPSQRAKILRDKAHSLQRQIDSKLNPATARQNMTRRRLQIMQGKRHDANRLMEIQQALRAIADHLDADTLPYTLATVITTTKVMAILHDWQYKDSPERRDLTAIMQGQPISIDPHALKIREAEEKLFGQKIDGFFPTPKELADRMVVLAELQEDDEVLEPSAGKGDLADAVTRYCKHSQIETTLTCIETHYELCQILELKGYQTYRSDFMAVQGTVDKIIMNPPFEKGLDAQHVMHAYQLLKPGGIMVAILGAGVLFRQTRLETEFRKHLADWLLNDELIHQEKLEDAFKGPQAFNQTGVSCLLIAVRKRGL